MSHTSISSTAEKVEAVDMADNGIEKGNVEREGQATSTKDAAEHPKGFRLAMVILALVLSVFLVALDMISLNIYRRRSLQADSLQTIVATAIPRITDQFHSLDQIGWYGSAFFLTLASFQSTWGKVYKFFPLKAAFICAIAIFEFGSLICGE